MRNFEYVLDSEGILKTVKYSKNKLRNDLIINVIVNISLLAMIFLLSYLTDAIFVEILFVTCIAALGSFSLWYLYAKEKNFCVKFHRENIEVVNSKKRTIILCTDIKKLGFLSNVGTANLMDLGRGWTDTRGKKTTFFMTTTVDFQKKKLTNYALTRVIVSHGFFKKSIFFLSDYSDTDMVSHFDKWIKFNNLENRRMETGDCGKPLKK